MRSVIGVVAALLVATACGGGVSVKEGDACYGSDAVCCSDVSTGKVLYCPFKGDGTLKEASCSESATGGFVAIACYCRDAVFAYQHQCP